MLKVQDLQKKYHEVVAVDGISFSVAENEIVGLLGPNGAGKTTTISMMLGVLEPTAGTIELQGIDIQKDKTTFMQKTNFAASYAQLPGNLTVAQNLKVFGMLYDVQDLDKKIENALTEFDITQFRDTRTGALSSGEQMRVSLAKAMLSNPALLFLDEPTASLDPSTARTIREKILAYSRAAGHAVLWTSHNMHEVEEVCDRVLFLSHGKILLEGNPKTLAGEHGKKNLEELFITVAREPLTLDI